MKRLLFTPLFIMVLACSQAAGPGAGGDTAAGGSGAGSSNTGGAPPCTPGDTQCDAHSCGAPNHDCLGGACSGGLCQPVELVEHVRPWLAMTGNSVYGDRRDPVQGQVGAPCGAEWVFRVAKSSGLAETLIRRRVDALLTDDAHLYFWTYELQGSGCERDPNDHLWRMPLEGGTPEFIGDPTNDGIEPQLRDGRIYELALAPGGQQFESFPVSGGAATPIGAPFDDGAVTFLGMDTTSLYWYGIIDKKGLGVVRAMSAADGALRTIVDHEPISDVIIDDAYAYYLTFDGMTGGASIHRVPLGGGPTENLYDNPEGYNVLLRVVGDEIFTSSHREADGHESLVALPRAGGVPRTVLDGFDVLELLADDEAIYFVGRPGDEDAALYRLAR